MVKKQATGTHRQGECAVYSGEENKCKSGIRSRNTRKKNQKDTKVTPRQRVNEMAKKVGDSRVETIREESLKLKPQEGW